MKQAQPSYSLEGSGGSPPGISHEYGKSPSFLMEKLTIGFPPEHKTTKRRRIVYTMVEAECAKPTRQAAEVTEA